MKNGYYIHFDAKLTPGVQKKIDMQVQELKKHFIVNEINVLSEKVCLAKRLLRLLPGGAIDRTYSQALDAMDSPDFIYVRRATADRFYVDFFRSIKKRWPACKIMIEIFTYPYDKDEFMKMSAWPYYFKERYNRKRLIKYIDRYVTYSGDRMIFGIPTIQTGNGIVVDNVKLPTISKRENDEVNLIAVAFMQRHHGYERVIKGMYQYYQKSGLRNVVCHLVGNGPEKEKYIKLVRKYGLENRVKFYPTLLGDDLDLIYEKGDIALSALGCYKDGVDRENSLKSREYMAKGFPMISCCKVDGLDKEYPFLYQLSNDSQPVDIEKILQFYDKLLSKYSKNEIQQKVRAYVKEIADMLIVMQPIIDFINEQ